MSLGKGSHLYEGSGRSGALAALLQVRRGLVSLNGAPETGHSDDRGKAWVLSFSDTGTN